ncbi:MAG: PIN domain-containing protein [bacterium]
MEIKLIPIDNEINNKFIELMNQYSLSHKLSIPDSIIAATAIINNVRLFTLNLKDFKFISDLELYQS